MCLEPPSSALCPFSVWKLDSFSSEEQNPAQKVVKVVAALQEMFSAQSRQVIEDICPFFGL